MKLSLWFLQYQVTEVYGGLVTPYIVISAIFQDAVNKWDYTASVTK